MDKSEKFKIGGDKSVPVLTRASVLYGDLEKTRAMILAIPGYGSSIDLLLSERGKQFAIQRLEQYFDQLSKRLEQLEVTSTELKDDESVYDLFQSMCAHSQEKITRFASLTGDFLEHNRNWDETEIAINLIAELSDDQILILKYVNEAPKSDISVFKDLQIVSVEVNESNFFPSLEKAFDYLSIAAIKMYCSGLISRGLLHDEGIGRMDNGALDLLVPTELTGWLLEKINVFNDT